MFCRRFLCGLLKKSDFTMMLNRHKSVRNLCLKLNDSNRKELPNKISSLYVPGRYGKGIYQIVKPVIDANYLSENIHNLKQSCFLRGIEIDFETLIPMLRDWETLRNELSALSDRSREMGTELKRLRGLDSQEDCEKLEKDFEECIARIRPIKDKVYDLEDVVMPLVQMIPNFVDDSVAAESISKSQIHPHEFKFRAASHVEIGKKMSQLEFSTLNPTSYYLSGSFSELELICQTYFYDKLCDLGFAPLSCVDFVKSFVVEAVGLDPYSFNDCIIIKDKSVNEHAQKQILVGGASFEAFCAYLTNMNVSKSNLPLKYFSIGRRYEAKYRNNVDPSLFTSVQSVNIHSMSLCDKESEVTEFESLFNSMVSLYTDLNIPFRTVNVGLKNLNYTETMRKTIELWSPSKQSYVPVAHVSLRSDFVSRRLHITYGTEHLVDDYCSIVEGVVSNFSVLVGCLVEDLQNEDFTFRFPEVFK